MALGVLIVTQEGLRLGIPRASFSRNAPDVSRRTAVDELSAAVLHGPRALTLDVPPTTPNVPEKQRNAPEFATQRNFRFYGELTRYASRGPSRPPKYNSV